MGKKRIGVYPGTFDPVTNGHLDIIERATNIVDHLILAVAINRGKGPLFSLEERVAMVEHELPAIMKRTGATIEVKPFESLLMNFAKDQGAKTIVRGLRAVSDFEYEFQMAGMNSHLSPDIETVFLMASDKCQFISSRFVKEIGKLGGDISDFVTPNVKEKLLERFEAED
ncbi:pantetheine-phosphate adenylyltransferase [Terasakiella sp. SH-1]|uniref:pantetheine-phosphate adenylyltransferase n=1 Tax=Terasakiella sp. SH-1 TaxID=2560057 RepID=UPI00107417EC|nr:pantetheine-phosphate adenylyltransferase [Terasakiella sp. SH-1]